MSKRIVIVANIAFAWALSAANAQEGVKLSTPTFGFQGKESSPDGKEYAYIYDSAGSVIKTISLADCEARPGRFGDYALLFGEWNALTRTVQIFDGSGALKSTFDIDGVRTPSLGKELIAFVVRSHTFARPYDIKFVDYAGKLVAHVVNDSSRLIRLDYFDNGQWLACSLRNKERTCDFTMYDALGKELWTYDSKQSNFGVVAHSVVSARTALLLASSDVEKAVLHIFDAQGASLASLETAEFPLVLFTPGDNNLLLIGFPGTQLRNATTGEQLWSTPEAVRLAGGTPVAFSSDGQSYFAAVTSHNDLDQPVSLELKQWSLQTNQLLLSRPALSDVSGSACHVVALQQSGQTVTLVMPQGFVPIDVSD